MSLASKVTLASSVVVMFGAFIYDLYDKEIQLANLHKGVVKDLERQQLQQQNLVDLTRQLHVEEQYRKNLQEKEQKSES